MSKKTRKESGEMSIQEKDGANEEKLLSEAEENLLKNPSEEQPKESPSLKVFTARLVAKGWMKIVAESRDEALDALRDMPVSKIPDNILQYEIVKEERSS